MTLKELFEQDFIVLDTETTGLSISEEYPDEVIELGIIDKNGKTLYKSLFKPKKRISYGAQQKNHITTEMLKDAPLFKDEWPKIYPLLKDKLIVIHNARFDTTMVIQTMKVYKIYDKSQYSSLFSNIYDSIKVCRKILGGGKLEDYAKKLGIKEPQTHRATDDCKMTLEVLKRLIPKEAPSGVDEKLYDKLRKLRSNIAEKEDCELWDIAYNSGLQNMAMNSGNNMKTEANIKVFLQGDYKKYSKEFLDTIDRYNNKKESPNKSGIKGCCPDSKINDKNKDSSLKPKSHTRLEYLEAYKEYQDIRKIAEKFGVQESTVKTALIDVYFMWGIPFDVIKPFIQEEYEDDILKIIKELNMSPIRLKPIKEKLPECVTYETIRYAIKKNGIEYK